MNKYIVFFNVIGMLPIEVESEYYSYDVSSKSYVFYNNDMEDTIEEFPRESVLRIKYSGEKEDG